MSRNCHVALHTCPVDNKLLVCPTLCSSRAASRDVRATWAEKEPPLQKSHCLRSGLSSKREAIQRKDSEWRQQQVGTKAEAVERRRGMAFWRHLWRTCREITENLLYPQCSICLDELPSLADSCKDLVENANRPTFFRLKTCHHCFCTECIRQYVQLKIKEHQVENDQLVCPQLNCRKTLMPEDLQKLLQRDGYVKYQQLLQRKRDEQNPNSRWCVNKSCGELIVCENDRQDTFQCPKCQCVGCFLCGKEAHSKWTKWWTCDRSKQQKRVDSSYLRWEKSVGSSEAVRECPRCEMRIWKNGGCNHMTCSNCRYEYCWMCGSKWHASHYQCGEGAIARADAVAVEEEPVSTAESILAMVLLLVVVVLISVVGIYTFVFYFVIFRALGSLVRRHRAFAWLGDTNEDANQQETPPPPRPAGVTDAETNALMEEIWDQTMALIQLMQGTPPAPAPAPTPPAATPPVRTFPFSMFGNDLHRRRPRPNLNSI